MAYIGLRNGDVARVSRGATLKLVEGRAVPAGEAGRFDGPETHLLVSERIFVGVDPRPAVWSSYLRSQGVAAFATLVDLITVVTVALVSGCSAAFAGALGALA